MSLLVLALAVTALLGSIRAGVIEVAQETLKGWQHGDHASELLYDPLHTRNASDLPHQLPLPASRGWVRQISWKPRAFIWHNFITDEEAKHIINLALPTMKRSTVVGQGGKSVEDNYRTSFGTFLHRYQDAVVERLENKVAAWTQLPVEHQEDIQVLRYGLGQTYKPHADTLKDDEAGSRVATVLVYLNEPTQGGETAFPNSEWAAPELERMLGDGFSPCAQGHVGMRPKRGDALLFWSINPDGATEDFHAVHTGCPVLEGVKWTLTKWIHARPFRPYTLEATVQTKGLREEPNDPGICKDLATDCARLAKNNGCESNRDYMVVGVAYAGQCRKTCGACQECAEGDRECYNQNRQNVGFLPFYPGDV